MTTIVQIAGTLLDAQHVIRGEFAQQPLEYAFGRTDRMEDPAARRRRNVLQAARLPPATGFVITCSLTARRGS